MLSSNYNVLQCSADDKDKYGVGQIFEVPKHHLRNPKFARFHGLEIKSITYGFGIFLHFDNYEWEKNNPFTEPEPKNNNINFPKF